ncbi:MAG: hypothetical protein HY543_03620 [Deltaproteobacteria bacterium]|nr:hypothetical protein [Deltaproteobacteria bacterium]
MRKPISGQSHRIIAKVVADLTRAHGAAHRRDIREGVRACARIWNFRKDGTDRFVEFCRRHYLPPGPEKRSLLHRLDELHGVIDGAMTVISKAVRAGLDLADHPLTPADELFGAFTPRSHLEEDYRAFRIAHLVQLNFGTDRMDVPATREGWVARRLAEWGREAVPAALKAEASRVFARVDAFVTGYNLYLDQIDFGDPEVTFPKDTRAISHWGLRDTMMQLYDDPAGLKKQRAILDLMRRVVDGQVPTVLLNNPDARWDIPRHQVRVGGKTMPETLHGPLRWTHFRSLFQALRKIDPHTRFGNMIRTKFLEDRELPEPRVRKILTGILGAAAASEVGKWLARRLGRPLEPFDIYFKQFTRHTDERCESGDLAQRFPDRASLQNAIPQILAQLGFAADVAAWIGSKIRVDNGRSAGHAWAPRAPFDWQLLRVRIPKGGMTTIEFATFMHELGHCVEGVFSSYRMDYRTLWGVPNSALSEAFAFTFQDQADRILGVPRRDDPRVATLQRFWEVFEIAGPALVEMDFFHWLYRHPRATPLQMQRAIRRIADRCWARYHARIFGAEGHGLLAVYSHILWCDLYLADYPLGYVAAYQIRRFLEGKDLGTEMPRICRAGRIYPDEWMRHAVGAPIDAAPLLHDTAAALAALRRAERHDMTEAHAFSLRTSAGCAGRRWHRGGLR